MNDGEEFEVNGRTFIFKTEQDTDTGPPWKEHDGHGVISDWERYDQETADRRIVSQDRRSVRFYDMKASLAKAIKEGWGLGEDGARHEFRKLHNYAPIFDPAHEFEFQLWFKGLSERQKCKIAVERDFERMKAWCAEAWCWIGVIVKDVESGEGASLWGIESDAGDYLDEVARELAEELFPLAEAHEAAALELATD